MQILDNLIILSLPILAFIAGMKLERAHNEDTIDSLLYLVRLHNTPTGQYLPPYQPKRRRRANIGQKFMDVLHANGRATTRL